MENLYFNGLLFDSNIRLKMNTFSIVDDNILIFVLALVALCTPHN